MNISLTNERCDSGPGNHSWKLKTNGKRNSKNKNKRRRGGRTKWGKVRNRCKNKNKFGFRGKFKGMYIFEAGIRSVRSWTRLIVLAVAEIERTRSNRLTTKRIKLSLSFFSISLSFSISSQINIHRAYSKGCAIGLIRLAERNSPATPQRNVTGLFV